MFFPNVKAVHCLGIEGANTFFRKIEQKKYRQGSGLSCRDKYVLHSNLCFMFYHVLPCFTFEFLVASPLLVGTCMRSKQEEKYQNLPKDTTGEHQSIVGTR